MCPEGRYCALKGVIAPLPCTPRRALLRPFRARLEGRHCAPKGAIAPIPRYSVPLPCTPWVARAGYGAWHGAGRLRLSEGCDATLRWQVLRAEGRYCTSKGVLAPRRALLRLITPFGGAGRLRLSEGRCHARKEVATRRVLVRALLRPSGRCCAVRAFLRPSGRFCARECAREGVFAPRGALLRLEGRCCARKGVVACKGVVAPVRTLLRP